MLAVTAPLGLSAGNISFFLHQYISSAQLQCLANTGAQYTFESNFIAIEQMQGVTDNKALILPSCLVYFLFSLDSVI